MSTGLNARRATGLTVAESKESFTRTESVARWSREGRAVYEAEREALLYVFFVVVDWCKVFQSDRKLFHEGTGFFFFPTFSVSFPLLLRCCCAVLLCRAVLSFSMSKEEKAVRRTAVHTRMSKRKRITLPRVCTYVRHVSERRGPRTSGNRPRSEGHRASELFSPE